MTDIKTIPIAIKDIAESQLEAGVSASATTILLNTGDGAKFPDTKKGDCIAGGSATLLKSVGIGDLVAENDLIYNLTKGESAVVRSVSTDQVTTTKLGNGATWATDDVWTKNPFILTLFKKVDGVITTYEKILIHSRSTDSLFCLLANRGFSGTTAQSWEADDFASLFVEDKGVSEHFNRITKNERLIDDVLDNDVTIGGLKTFTTLPQSTVTPSDSKDLITKQYFDDNSGGVWAHISTTTVSSSVSSVSISIPSGYKEFMIKFRGIEVQYGSYLVFAPSVDSGSISYASILRYGSNLNTTRNIFNNVNTYAYAKLCSGSTNTSEIGGMDGEMSIQIATKGTTETMRGTSVCTYGGDKTHIYYDESFFRIFSDAGQVFDNFIFKHPSGYTIDAGDFELYGIPN